MLSLLVEEDFALHVAVENGIVTFDDVGVKIFTALHIVIAIFTFKRVLAFCTEQIIFPRTTL